MRRSWLATRYYASRGRLPFSVQISLPFDAGDRATLSAWAILHG
jgi:hypothetical protein